MAVNCVLKMLFRLLLIFVCLTVINSRKSRQTTALRANDSLSSNKKVLNPRKLISQESQRLEKFIQQTEDEDTEIIEEYTTPYTPPRRGSPRTTTRIPPRQSDEEVTPGPEPYSIGWDVEDKETGAKSGRQETQDKDGNVVGYYYITDAEGRMRRVDYTAGPDGFKANIRSNEEGLEMRSPADVNLEISPPVKEQPKGYGNTQRLLDV